MKTIPNQSSEQWIVTLRRASAGSTATVFPLTPGPKACAAWARSAALVRHQQTVWTCTLPLLDWEVSVATTAELAVARSR